MESRCLKQKTLIRFYIKALGDGVVLKVYICIKMRVLGLRSNKNNITNIKYYSF